MKLKTDNKTKLILSDEEVTLLSEILDGISGMGLTKPTLNDKQEKFVKDLKKEIEK